LRQERNNIFAGVDWILVFFYIVLVGFGWLNIYAAIVEENNFEILDFSKRYGKQLIWIGLCFPLIILILFFNSKFYEKYASIFYVISFW